MCEATHIASILGGRKVLGVEVTGVDDLITLVRRGLPVAVLDCLAARTGLGRDVLGARLTQSGRTLTKRRKGHYLKPAESDRAVRIARVFARAESVLGRQDKAGLWLRRPNRALGMVEPGSLLDTDLGARLVTDVLSRIEHGTFS